jgi:hypothetical protein
MKANLFLVLEIILIISVSAFASNSYLIGTLGYQYSKGLMLVSFSPYVHLDNFIFKMTFPAYIDLKDFSLKSFTKWDSTIDYAGYEDRNLEIAITSKDGYFRDYFDTSIYEYSENKYIFYQSGQLYILKGMYGIDDTDRYASLGMNLSPVFLYFDYNNGDIGITGTYSLKPFFATANYYSDGSISFGASFNSGNISVIGKYYYKRPYVNFGLKTVNLPKYVIALDAKDIAVAVTNSGNYLLYFNSEFNNFQINGIYQKDSYDVNLSYKVNVLQFYAHLKNLFIEVGVNAKLL